MAVKIKGILTLMLLLLLAGQMPGQDISGTNFSGIVGAGARALGMGGAFIAIADDATAASWNPAGLGQLERPELTLVTRFQSFRSVVPASGDSLTLFEGSRDLVGSSTGFDFMAFTYPIRIGNFKIVPQISHQRVISYDLDFRSNNRPFFTRDIHPLLNIPVEERGIRSEDQLFVGGVDVVSFSLGAKLWNWLSLGVSANVWVNGYEGSFHEAIESQITTPDGAVMDYKEDFTEKLEVDIRGFNLNLGVLVDVTSKLKIGAVYKNSFTVNDKYRMSIDGDVMLGDARVHVEEEYPGSSPLRWPETFGVGFSYRPIDPLTISMDITATRWSETIMQDFPKDDDITGEVTEVDVYFPTMEEAGLDFKQLDTFQFRLGVEYVLIGEKSLIPLRLGFFTDSQHYADASGERVVFIGATAGVGYRRGRFGIDFAAMLETGNYLASTYDYTVTSYLELRTYLSLSYNFR